MSDRVEILLVEDNPADAELTQRALRRNRVRNDIHWVQDGAEALDFLFSEGAYAPRAGMAAPRLVLLDLKLPKVDGMDVLRRMKADARTKGIPVVMMTSSQEERDLVASYELGVNSYVVKPMEFEEFTKVVGQVGLYWDLVNKTPT